MIYAHISDAERYYSLGEIFPKVFELLSNPELEKSATGKIMIIPGKAWINIDKTVSRTPADAPFESHRDFIDIQMTLKGAELIGYQPVHSLSPLTKYKAETDLQFYSGEGTMLDCTNGMFAIFFPEDGHRPCIAPDGETAPLKKAVAKIHISLLR